MLNLSNYLLNYNLIRFDLRPRKNKLTNDGNIMADAITLSESSLRCGAYGVKRRSCLTAQKKPAHDGRLIRSGYFYNHPGVVSETTLKNVRL